MSTSELWAMKKIDGVIEKLSNSKTSELECTDMILELTRVRSFIASIRQEKHREKTGWDTEAK